MRDIFRTPLGGMLGAPIPLLGQGGDAPARPANPEDWTIENVNGWRDEAVAAWGNVLVYRCAEQATNTPQAFFDSLEVKTACPAEMCIPEFVFELAGITAEEAGVILSIQDCLDAGGPIECAADETLNADGVCEKFVCPPGYEPIEGGWCFPIQGGEYTYGCLRLNGKYDIVDPFTGEIFQREVLHSDLPPNSIRLPDNGTLCNPCPADLEPHNENYDAYGCCEPASYERDDRGQCVKTQVCFRPEVDAGNLGPAEYSTEPETVSEVVDTALCEEEPGGPDIGGEGEDNTLSTVLAAGGALTALTAVGIALFR